MEIHFQRTLFYEELKLQAWLQDQALVTQELKRWVRFNLTLSSIILEILYDGASDLK